MQQYVIRDGQGNSYGPADIQTIRRWIAEHRVTPLMQVAEAGSPDFRPATSHPELLQAFSESPYAAAYNLAATPAAAPARTPAANSAASPATPGMIAGTPTQPVASYKGSYPANEVNYAVTQPDTGLAIASLVCSIAGLFICPFVVCTLGIIFGHIQRARVRQNPQQYGGDGLALAGMIIGYCAVGLWLLVAGIYALFIVAVVASSGRP